MDAATAGAVRKDAPYGRPRVVLGMTLYNNARHLPEAIESLLAQTHSDFTLVLLDDASADETEAVARGYASRDPRVRYFTSRQPPGHGRHLARGCADRRRASVRPPRYFAWVSDHDRWHPRWLERLLAELERRPGAVLAYPITRRIGQDGAELDKGPRLFDTAGCRDLRAALAAHVPRRGRRRRHGLRPDAPRRADARPAFSGACCGPTACSSPS